MAKSKLFQYVVLWHPTEKQEKEEGLKTKIIIDPKNILSSEERHVAIAASMEIPSEYKSDLEQIEILVRPF